MEIKKIYILLVIILWSLFGYFYLQGKYNPYTVEMQLDSSVHYEVIKEISVRNKMQFYTVNYIMPYRDETLIMTTGQDQHFRTIEVIHGNFILMDYEGKGMVIGDKVADAYFKTENPVGRRITFFDEEYEILGVLRNSADIYIPYEEDLLDLRWNKVFFYYQPSQLSIFNIKVEDMKRELATHSIREIDMVIYQDKLYSYINYILLSLIGILVMMTRKPYQILVREMNELWNGYQKDKKKVEFYHYGMAHKKEIFRILFLAVIIGMILFVIYKLIWFIEIPLVVIPDNLFSPASYWRTMKSMYELWYQRMNRGFSTFLIDTIVIHLVMLSVIFMILTRWLCTEKKTMTIWRGKGD